MARQTRAALGARMNIAPRSTSSCATARPPASGPPGPPTPARCATSSPGWGTRPAGSASSPRASTSSAPRSDSVAPADGRALLVLTGAPERVVGHAIYVRTEPDEAEVAFAIDATWQGRGLATTLLAHLADAAAAEGIGVFVAITLADNHRMIGVFRASGFPVEVRVPAGRAARALPDVADRRGPAALRGARARRRRRGGRARAAPPRRCWSRRPRPGRARSAASAGQPAAASPARCTPCCRPARRRERRERARSPPCPARSSWPCSRCAARASCRRRARARPAATCGRSSCCSSGRRRPTRAELLATCRAGGMRLVGPHCLGVVNTDPAVPLDATFAPDAPAPGPRRVRVAERRVRDRRARPRRRRAASASRRSCRWATRRTCRATTCCSTGSGTPAPDAVAALPRVVRQPAPLRPGRAPRHGRQAGDRGQERRAPAAAAAAASHTGALLAASDRPVDALFRHAGVIRTDTLAEMFDLAALLTRQPAPRGDRVAIVDERRRPGRPVRRRLRRGRAARRDARRARAAARSPARAAGRPRSPTRSTSPPRRRPRTTSRALARGARGSRRRRGDRAVRASLGDAGGGRRGCARRRPRAPAARPCWRCSWAPTRRRPREPPARSALRRARGGGRARSRAPSSTAAGARPPDPIRQLAGLDADRAAAIVAAGLAAAAAAGRPTQVERLLRCYGLPAPRRSGSARASAARAARGSAVRSRSRRSRPARPQVRRGRRAAGLSGPTAVERAAREALAAAREPPAIVAGRRARPADGAAGYRAAASASRATRSFGPLVALAAGGATAELVGDVQVRLAPVGPREAGAMVPACAASRCSTASAAAPRGRPRRAARRAAARSARSPPPTPRWPSSTATRGRRPGGRHGKNRLFFMSNYEWFRQRRQVQAVSNLPSAAMRTGNFSELPRGTQGIFDPRTRGTRAGPSRRRLFRGTSFPSNRIHPTSVKLLEFSAAAEPDSRT